MAYDEQLADRIRLGLHDQKITFEEKKMMGGLCFMVNDKMCVGLLTDKTSGRALLMARIGEAAYPEALNQPGVSEMNFTGRSMKGYVFIEEGALETEPRLAHWLELALAFNPLAKASKQKAKKASKKQ